MTIKQNETKIEPLSSLDILSRNPKTNHPTLMHCGLRITLYNLDGTNDQMNLSFPVLTTNMDIFETGAFYLKGWIEHLTKYHLKIKKFTIDYTTTDWNGHSIASITETHEIPLGKVFIPSWRLGKWMNPETVKKQEMKARERRSTSKR